MMVKAMSFKMPTNETLIKKVIAAVDSAVQTQPIIEHILRESLATA